MATLLLTAAGSLLGPIGGAIGSLVGRQIDSAIFGGGSQTGPRLKELAVTTSSYGSALPRIFGRMRVPGTIIWATDLVEHREKSGGGKGRPSVTTYSYSASFAVALASRPIKGIGRIWADGNLLRGAAGDLKVDGTYRLHTGERDQLPDPLLAAAEGFTFCPAFRGIAYLVFEDLDLADFGNRIPALTFEVFADSGELTVAQLAEEMVDRTDAAVALPGLLGMACEGPLSETLVMLDPVYPMDCDACGDLLVLSPERLQSQALTLAEPAISTTDGDFGGPEGHSRRRAPAPAAPPQIIRYYDVDRDYQPGLQRTGGTVPAGQPQSIELPVSLGAQTARGLVEGASRRSNWKRETILWRSVELDPAITPGSVVAVSGQRGRWRVSEWEWRASGVELTLQRIPPIAATSSLPTDPGRASSPIDALAMPTALAAFELPWDGIGTGDSPSIFAAVSSAGTGWTGAALFVDRGDGSLVPLGPSGRSRSIMGTVVNPPAPVSPLLVDRTSALVVDLIGSDMVLADATIRQLSMGANRALVGSEIIQFGRATSLGSGRWRLEQLLRGRGGTESAMASHTVDEIFVLLDDAPVQLDQAAIGTSAGAEILALGRGDLQPVPAAIASPGATLQPFAPVHGRIEVSPDGALDLSWTRRARGSYAWSDGVEVPLNEQAEGYFVTFGPPANPVAVWETSEPRLSLSPATRATLTNTLPDGAFYIRQRGTHALSEPLILAFHP